VSDRELLELAAEAAGLAWEWNACAGSIEHIPKGYRFYVKWNPLTDDGDAFRLAIKLNLLVEYFPDFESEMSDIRYSEDPQQAARRAVVNAAAQIGKSLA
jgi:hypothetical protein